MTKDVSPPLAQATGRTLSQLFADEREFVWRSDPLAASADGNRAIERDELNAREQVSYDLFEFMVSQRELKIVELRKRTEATLGAAFDLRAMRC